MATHIANAPAACGGAPGYIFGGVVVWQVKHLMQDTHEPL